MIKEHLETIMMVAFLVATALSIYKVYVIFEKQAGEGLSVIELEKEIIAIIEELFKEGRIEKEKLFSAITSHTLFKQDEYKNFNQNRFNQVLDRMYIENGVENYEELLEKKNPKR